LQKALKAARSNDTQGKIEAGVAGATAIIDTMVRSATQRKQAAKEYYESVIGGQYK